MPDMPAVARLVVTSAPYRMFARRVLLPSVLRDARPAGQGLEIGAGCGVMSAELLAAFPTLRMIATDCDPKMVHAARRTLRTFGDRIDVARADAAHLPFADNRFDLVAAAAMLHHVPTWRDAVEQAVRVLRPGGHLIGYDPLEGPLTRLVHIAERQTTHMLRPGELEAHLDRLPVSHTRVVPGLGGMVIRFSAAKTTGPPSGPAGEATR